MRFTSCAAAIFAAAALLSSSPAFAEVGQDRFDAAGYFRVMARPDLQGGNGRLGYWNLYGRLLNEGPWAALELRLDVVPPEPGGGNAWTSLQARIEGGSVANAHPALGRLDNFFLSQLYALAGNVILDKVTWRIGTLEYYFGDLGLYDLRPAQIFFETIGLSATWKADQVELLLGVGDAGWHLRRDQYNSVISAGGAARFRITPTFELGVGGQMLYEPEVQGNRFAPHATPGLSYENFVRGEILLKFLEENPGQENLFPHPEPTSATSWKAVAYLGFGGFGPLRWNNLFANATLRHPDQFVTEASPATGREFDIYIEDLTDERMELVLGNETQLELVPQRLDAILAFLVGHATDADNDIQPTDFDRTYYSGVLRLQLYMTETVHLLGETSLAREVSHNGNAFRRHRDSVFQSEDGMENSRGLEYGDSDTRDTWQGKVGVVLNPQGIGIFNRPSLRLLYGVQHSTQNLAFGNSFVEDSGELDYFGSPEVHWHHILSLETEAWF